MHIQRADTTPIPSVGNSTASEAMLDQHAEMPPVSISNTRSGFSGPVSPSVVGATTSSEAVTGTVEKPQSKRPTTNKKAATITLPKKQRASNSRRVEPPIKTYISDLTDLDVICGRGSRSNNHTGNKVFWGVVRTFENAYEACEENGKAGARRSQTDTKKNEVAQQVVDFIHNTQRGRFVEFDKESRQWFIVSDKTARDKVKQALRDIRKKAKNAAPALRGQQNLSTLKNSTTITTTAGTNPHHQEMKDGEEPDSSSGAPISFSFVFPEPSKLTEMELSVCSLLCSVQKLLRSNDSSACSQNTSSTS